MDDLRHYKENLVGKLLEYKFQVNYISNGSVAQEVCRIQVIVDIKINHLFNDDRYILCSYDIEDNEVKYHFFMGCDLRSFIASKNEVAFKGLTYSTIQRYKVI